MNSTEPVTKAWVLKFARELRSRLLGVADECDLSLFAPTKVWVSEDDSVDGWFAAFGRLAKAPNLQLEVWVDRYVDTNGHRLWYGIGASRPQPIRGLAARVQHAIGEPLVSVSDDLIEQDGTNARKAPLTTAQYHRAIQWHHLGCHGLGRYEQQRLPASQVTRARFLHRAEGYLIELARAFRTGPGHSTVRPRSSKTSGNSPHRASATGKARARAARLAVAAAEEERESRGQGFTSSSDVRLAIEKYAMDRAKAFYRAQGYDWEDVSKRASYDLRCTRGREELRVEVKGTRGTGDAILITRNSRRGALNYADRTRLFVLHSLQVYEQDGVVRVRGGVRREGAWDVRAGRMRALTYEYTLPEQFGLD